MMRDWQRPAKRQSVGTCRPAAARTRYIIERTCGVLPRALGGLQLVRGGYQDKLCQRHTLPTYSHPHFPTEGISPGRWWALAGFG